MEERIFKYQSELFRQYATEYVVCQVSVSYEIKEQMIYLNSQIQKTIGSVVEIAHKIKQSELEHSQQEVK